MDSIPSTKHLCDLLSAHTSQWHTIDTTDKAYRAIKTFLLMIKAGGKFVDVLFEGCYQYLRDEYQQNNFYEDPLGQQLVSIRQQYWQHHFGVPTLAYLLACKESIACVKAFFMTDANSTDVDALTNQLASYKKALFSEINAVEPGCDGSGLFIPTKNKQGFMTTTLDHFSQAFVQHADQVAIQQGIVLDVGAAYGIASLKALATGARVICNDLDPEHLTVIQCKASLTQRDRLTLLPGTFPDELMLPENYLDAILICRVMHFFNGINIIKALSTMHTWLKPGGRLYVINETPYMKAWQTFIPEFEKRKAKGEQWPGLITDTATYGQQWSASLPPLVHWLDKDTLEKALVQVGFEQGKIEAGYINRAGQFPPDLLLDGKESIGAIAEK